MSEKRWYWAKYRDNTLKIEANGTFEAQIKAFDHWKPKHRGLKRYQIDVYVADRDDGDTVTLSPCQF